MLAHLLIKRARRSKKHKTSTPDETNQDSTPNDTNESPNPDQTTRSSMSDETNMSRPLEGKVALITGSSKGIGRATALRLAYDGAKVVINYASGAKDAEEVVDIIGTENAVAIQADASNIREIEGLVAKTVTAFGKIDILVASAGVLPMKDLESTTEADFDRTFALNVKGPYFLVQVCRNCTPSQ